MGAISETLRRDLRQAEFSEGYAESFQDAYVATQIKVLREQNQWTQADLAKELGTTQTAISRIENVNYSAWNISTLKKLARAFRVRLKVSFETYGSLIHDVDSFSREGLQRVPRESDPELNEFATDREQNQTSGAESTAESPTVKDKSTILQHAANATGTIGQQGATPGAIHIVPVPALFVEANEPSKFRNWQRKHTNRGRSGRHGDKRKGVGRAHEIFTARGTGSSGGSTTAIQAIR